VTERWTPPWQLVCRNTRRTDSTRRTRTTALAFTFTALTILATCLSQVPATAVPFSTSGPSAATTRTAALDPQGLIVAVTSVAPTVATPRKPITIVGSVRNSGRKPVVAPVARALIGQRGLTSRQAVSDWATLAEGDSLRQVARIPLTKALAPGATAAFTLTIPANAISYAEPFAVLPLQVEVASPTSGSTSASSRVHTFLPTVATLKRFEPISIAWLFPLTLDPDPALHGTASPARDAAWTKAVGPGSRLDGLIAGTEAANVTWAIDPAVLGPREKPPAVAPLAPAVPSPSESPSTVTPTTPRGTAPVPPPPPARTMAAATTALAQRLKAAAPRHTLWSLPYADPDLAALLRITSGNRLASLITHPSTLDVAVGSARADIAWPATTLSSQNQIRLRRAFAPTGGLAAVVTSSSRLGEPNGDTGNATHQAGNGIPLLAYDESLSRTVANTSSKAAGALTVQHFLADSMALLGERPGTQNRSVLIAEPRTFAGDPAVLQALLTAAAAAPWLNPTTTGELLAASQKSTPRATGTSSGGVTDRNEGGNAQLAPTPPPGSPKTADPLSPGISPLTVKSLDSIPTTLSAIAGIASILDDGRLFGVDWADAQTQKLSTRWRGHPEGLNAIDAATRSAITTVSRGVRVAPSSVNFFADKGVLQVTVVNDLAVPIRDVRLTLTPSQRRLRIDRQPEPLKVGAKSRVNVKLPVTSIAAGLVGVEAVLTTRNGTPLGQNASVNVRVQPPGNWIYWVLGGFAGFVLVIGTQRSLRRGSTRASRPHVQEISIHD
jgi:hypothetical protein